MRTVRLLLVLCGAGLVGYGGWLLRPYQRDAAGWLLGGPILHDLLVAPVVGLVGLALSRLLPAPARRWVVAGLTVTAVLLLIAVPLLWRPDPAPANPGLQDRDYGAGLAIWLAVLWIVVLAGALGGSGPVRRFRAARAAARRPGNGQTGESTRPPRSSAFGRPSST